MRGRAIGLGYIGAGCFFMFSCCGYTGEVVIVVFGMEVDHEEEKTKGTCSCC